MINSISITLNGLHRTIACMSLEEHFPVADLSVRPLLGEDGVVA